MVLWRISNYADLLGIGAMEASARWHTAGRPVVYLAENPSSALLEVFVHLEADEGDRPDTYHLLKIEANDGIAHESVDPSSMSSGWRNNEAETRSIGDDWLVRGETALLKVPSAITPETWNWVLNPRHAQAKKVVIVHGEKHPYDSRLSADSCSDNSLENVRMFPVHIQSGGMTDPLWTTVHSIQVI